MSKILLFSISLVLITVQVLFAQEPVWRDLFNSKDLNNWTQLGGKASYEIDQGSILGKTVFGTPNSFLTTKEEFGDFILEFEVIVDPQINSGVQFRSQSKSDYRNGTVHGYQLEIDPSDRAFSGGIYDEQRSLWLYPLSRNDKARRAFKNGIWNHYRIEAIGTRLRTWVNGVLCADLIDNQSSKGFIGLQVHSVGSVEQAGKETRWRNIRILDKDPGIYVKEEDSTVTQISYLINELTLSEKRKGWRLLWDGKTKKGWRGAKSNDFPNFGWQMRDGILSILGTDGAEAAGPGDIITEELFSDFELELEFMITEGANSGIKYFVNPELNKGSGSAIGCEFQILDDTKHPDAKLGVNGNRTLGSLYDLIPANNLSIPGRGKQFKGIGSWNHVRIISRYGIIEHWLNNEKTLEYDRFSPMFKALVAYSKYKDWSGFGQWKQGHILLQDHGNTVHFRSIKIREF